MENGLKQNSNNETGLEKLQFLLILISFECLSLLF